MFFTVKQMSKQSYPIQNYIIYNQFYILQNYLDTRHMGFADAITVIPSTIAAGGKILSEIGFNCKFILTLGMLVLLVLLAVVYAWITSISTAIGEFILIIGVVCIGIAIALFIYACTNCCRKLEELRRDLFILIISAVAIILIIWVSFQFKKIQNKSWDPFPENQDFYESQKAKEFDEQLQSRLEKQKLKQLLKNKEIIDQLVQLEIKKRKSIKNEDNGSKKRKNEGKSSQAQL